MAATQSKARAAVDELEQALDEVGGAAQVAELFNRLDEPNAKRWALQLGHDPRGLGFSSNSALRLALGLAMAGFADEARNLLRARRLDGRAVSNTESFVLASLCVHRRGHGIRPGHYRESRAILDDIVAREPDHLQAHLALALHYIDSKRPVELWGPTCRRHLQQVLGQVPEHEQARYALARVDLLEGQLESAAGNLFELTRAGRVHANAWLYLHSSRLQPYLSSQQLGRVQAPEDPRTKPAAFEFTGAVDVSEVSQALNTLGFAIWRQAGDPARAQALLARFAADIEDICDVEHGGMWQQSDLGFGMQSASQALAVEFGALDVVRRSFDKRYRGWALEAHRAWCVQRRRVGREVNHKGLHQDHPVMSSKAGFAVIWMPLVECGPGRAASLELCTVPFEYELPFYVGNRGSKEALAHRELCSLIEPYFFVPDFEPGDLLFFGPNMLHCTGRPGNPAQWRVSVDIRYVAGPSLVGLAKLLAADAI